MIPGLIRKRLRSLLSIANKHLTNLHVKVRARSWQSDYSGYDHERFKYDIQRFLTSMQTDDQGIEFRYSDSCNKNTLYASVYACLTLSLIGELDNISDERRNAWISYFNSFQSNDDGLFYDPAVETPLFRNCDWWGARHLAVHMINAYTGLNSKPPSPFKFLFQYYDHIAISKWLDAYDWNSAFPHSNDIDNQIMNLGCLLQYHRDVWQDKEAGAAVKLLQEYLLERVNNNTGMWGKYDTCDPNQLSRMVQFAYHLFQIFFYDGIIPQYCDKIVEAVVATQNELGGFGVALNSSACEDIDSIDILVRLAPFVPSLKDTIYFSLQNALRWVLCNQANDGGLVFRLYAPFTFGHAEMTSASNHGAMLPTWFRTLSIAYLMKFFGNNSYFTIRKCPGYEY